MYQWSNSLEPSKCLIIYLYSASFTYTMLTDAWNEKKEAEEEMKLNWLVENGYVSDRIVDHARNF